MFRKKSFIIFFILSFIFTIVSPFIFHTYFQTLPVHTNTRVSFGAPFPFVEQTINLPIEKKSYPYEVSFSSPFKVSTKFHITAFLLSFLSFYLLFYSFFSIILRFFSSVRYRK